jgi:outer membrane protein OmpA-like peptidoglycan-associated protein
MPGFCPFHNSLLTQRSGDGVFDPLLQRRKGCPMKKNTIIALTSLIALAACSTDPETGKKRISKAAIGGVAGAVGGYFLGDVIGGRRDRTEKILGAGIGAVAGAGVGVYMDNQEKKLRQQTAGTGVEVQRQGDEIKLIMPSGVTFDTNSAAVKPEFRATLDQLATTLSQYEKTMVDVYGHTDTAGNDSINIPLSNNRAQAVANYLSMRGVNPARLGTQGFGSSQPIATNATESGKAANRRVEIKLLPVTTGAS